MLIRRGNTARGSLLQRESADSGRRQLQEQCQACTLCPKLCWCWGQFLRPKCLESKLSLIYQDPLVWGIIHPPTPYLVTIGLCYSLHTLRMFSLLHYRTREAQIADWVLVQQL